MILKIRLIITFQVLTLFSINIIEAQDFLDELPTSRRLNGKQTVKAFGIAGDNAKLSTITILSDKKAIALATIIDSDGYCVTKASELEGQEAFSAISPNSEKIAVDVLGTDKVTDLALLKIEPNIGKPVKWIMQKDYSQGSWVCSMNHKAESLMIGVVSAKSRSIKSRSGVLGVLLLFGFVFSIINLRTA